MSVRLRNTGRRVVIAIVASLIAVLGTAISASAQPKPGFQVQASCWYNVFAWVSTVPYQGNLSSVVSCSPAVQRITQTMYVHDYYTGAVVATVGPQDTFNTTSSSIAYHWYCSPFPHTYWGEVRATVVDYGGFTSNGSWSTQVLSC